tara:strand:+ start:112 stop:369 length:258 start_codon:yes stop_codon:yes gene_type:complete
MDTLRKLISAIIKEEAKKYEAEELLTEPDETEGREEDEASSGGVAGVSVPLGGGPNYPLPTRRDPKSRSPHEVAAAAFGGSKLKK